VLASLAHSLQQCGKIKIKFPIILFGKEYWEKVVNWDFMVERGVVSQVDVDALFFTDSVDDAYSMIVESLKHQLASVGFGPKGAAAPAPPAGSPLVPRAPRDPN
jgi:predicted Rossmann-fold nucleotide-binding protein